MLRVANPKYDPISRTLLEGTYIPQTAELVRQRQLALLRNEINLTITFDGGSNRRHQSFYTVHVTTADRRTYLIEAYAGSGVSHTAEWIKGLLFRVRCIVLQ